MKRRLYVVTGSSRGLGAAVARQLLGAPAHTLLGVSRRANPELVRAAAESGATCEQWQADLADPVPVAVRLRDWLARFDADRFESARLINNAGALAPTGALEDAGLDALSAALRVGLEAPLLLTAAFLAATADWTADRRVLNVSSGLGRRAMAGQATYCAAKAGMDHLSRAVALDQAEKARGARIVSLAPGVIDTDMQVQLRSADDAGFPDRANFVELEKTGRLTTPEDTATRLIAWLERADFGTTPVADIREP